MASRKSIDAPAAGLSVGTRDHGQVDTRFARSAPPPAPSPALRISQPFQPLTFDRELAAALGEAIAPPVTPKRIQRQRTKGWRMPEGAVYVGRPTQWGNRWMVADGTSLVEARPLLVAAFWDAIWRAMRVEGVAALRRWLAPLRGHDLACWCPLGQPCHADVLLELANRELRR